MAGFHNSAQLTSYMLWAHVTFIYSSWLVCNYANRMTGLNTESLIIVLLCWLSIYIFHCARKPQCNCKRVKKLRWIESKRGGGDGGIGVSGREDEKNDMAKWQQDEHRLMGEDSYEMRIGKMSKHDTMIDRWGGKARGGGRAKGESRGKEIPEINKYWWMMMMMMRMSEKRRNGKRQVGIGQYRSMKVGEKERL